MVLTLWQCPLCGLRNRCSWPGKGAPVCGGEPAGARHPYRFMDTVSECDGFDLKIERWPGVPW